MKQSLLALLVTGTALLTTGSAQLAAAEHPWHGSRPNIVIILSDDHGVWECGCYGNRSIRTPNIDQLAREGLRLTRAFTATAMCTPSRTMLYTGLFPHRNGAHPNHSSARPDVKSLPMYLRGLGYRVALAGKTHIKPRRVFPFEYLARKEPAIEEFLRSCGSQPFCLIIATHHPHQPWVPPEEGAGHDPQKIPVPPYLLDTPGTRLALRDYYNSVELLDQEVGQYLALLDRLKLAQSTLLIYTSDHGSQMPFSKWTLYDAGLRVPFVVRWPGHVRPGTISDAMICFVDVLPTLIDLAGGTPPENLDGRSFLAVLSGDAREHRQLIYGTHTNLGIISGSEFPIRAVRNQRFKYIWNLKPENTFRNIITEGRDQQDKPSSLWLSWLQAAESNPQMAARVRAYQHRPAEELYDVQADPYELRNLANDPQYQQIKAQLRARLIEWMHQQADPLCPEHRSQILPGRRLTQCAAGAMQPAGAGTGAP